MCVRTCELVSKWKSIVSLKIAVRSSVGQDCAGRPTCWLNLDDPDVEYVALVRLRRFAQRGVLELTLTGGDVRFGSLGAIVLNTAGNDSFELVGVHADLVSFPTFFYPLEGHVSRLTVVVGGPAEHLSLDACLHEALRYLLDQLRHLHSCLLICALLVEEFKHLSHEWLTHDQLEADLFVLFFKKLLL